MSGEREKNLERKRLKNKNGLRRNGTDVKRLCLSACMCVRHIPFLASLQSRRDLQAWVSVTTFYCLQACEQGLLFGRGLNSKSNKLGFFIWQRFFNCNGFLQFP